MILSSSKLTQMEDIEAYFAANPVGALWASTGSKKRETYTQTATKAGNYSTHSKLMEYPTM